MKMPAWHAAQAEIDRILAASHVDPFGLLGPHDVKSGTVIRAFVPHATALEAVGADGTVLGALDLRHAEGFFEGLVGKIKTGSFYTLRASNSGGAWVVQDAYQFPPLLGATDDYLIAEGTHEALYEKLGARRLEHCGVWGVQFAVFAPNAKRVSLVGPFNGWDGRRHPMRKRLGSGVFEIFMPGMEAGEIYKYEIVGPHGGLLPLKADPFAFQSEYRPATASVVAPYSQHHWTDAEYIRKRDGGEPRRKPMSTYEVHLGSWRRGEGNRYLTYDELAEQLIPYVSFLRFTHIELLPISEHPFDGSWGYQPIGLFSPTSRFGDPEGLRRFIDKAHAAGIGVIIDWVPAHFPTDEHGLARFDGTALYEHDDPRQGFHPDWQTNIFNFGRTEVSNFLVANALYWFDQFHVDGLRVDAVASMLYLDYSRKQGEWIPNKHGGNENLEAVAFLRKVNETVYRRYPGALMIAEESTAWPGVSQPVELGGLGFGFKWNMGWMHDSLSYMSKDPIHRRHHHDQMTFGLLYAFAENFVLPLSHDEVVHGKGSLFTKMPGFPDDKFANLRAYYAYMWAHPGKKLLFMGQEFGQQREWNFDGSLDWHIVGESGPHRGLQLLMRDLNNAYRNEPALHARDSEPDGFQWVVVEDRDQSVFGFMRSCPGRQPVVTISNFTPVMREDYDVGLPPGLWRVIINTDAGLYGGGNRGTLGDVFADGPPAHGQVNSAKISIPPLATLYLLREAD
jgi:1,4-alpha-glucan branching enzyme